MLTIVFILASIALLLVRSENRPGVWGAIARVMAHGADTQQKLIRNPWLVLGLFLLSLVSFAIGYLALPDGRWLTALAVLIMSFVGLAISDLSLTLTERSLGMLVRSDETRRHSAIMLAIATVFFWAYLLFPTSNIWIRICEITSLSIMYIGGLWAALGAIFHSLHDTFPDKGEGLATFVGAILRTILHHFVTIAVLSLGFLTYLNKLMPGTLKGGDDPTVSFLLLINYTVGKLTVAGSSLVTPSNTISGVIVDTLFSLLGPGFMALAVASMFTLSSRTDPEKTQHPQ